MTLCGLSLLMALMSPVMEFMELSLLVDCERSSELLLLLLLLLFGG